MAEQAAEDRLLLGLILRDPEKGIRALQKSYSGMLFHIVSRVLPGREEDTEEVIADVLVTVWREAEALLQQGRPLAAWLTVTARNKAIDRLRRLLRREALPLDEELGLTPEELTSDGEALICELVTALEEPDREIFLRKYYRLETAKEIGEVLGLTPHNVNVRLARGRARMKQAYLEQMGKEKPSYAKG